VKPPKHLVLDEDVHRALRKKKTETGITVKDLGNCALRSVFERPMLVEVIGEKLVSEGCLSEDEFNVVRAEALQQICTAAADVGSIVRKTKRNTLSSGSWEIEELAQDTDGTYQVLSAWVKDHRMRPIKLHKHDGIEYLTLLKGAILVSIDVESQIVTAPGSVTIPKGAFHSVTPLERDTRVLAVVSPPDPGFRVEKSE